MTLQAINNGFDANYGLFTSTPEGLAYPQPAATSIPNGLGLLEFLGLVVGKALYEGILLDVPLASFFVARLQGRRPMFDELAALDADLHRSLLQLKRYNQLAGGDHYMSCVYGTCCVNACPLRSLRFPMSMHVGEQNLV